MKEYHLIEGENHLFISKDALAEGIYHVILMEAGNIKARQKVVIQ